jgi:broad specificity phosphatase PhoE
LLWSLPLAAARAQASTVILVRHGEKTAPEGDAGLSEAGRVRADDLAVALASFPLGAIFVSQYRRTALTAEPVARAQQLTPAVVRVEKDIAVHAAAVGAAVRALPRGSAALVVGHSNTLGPIIRALGGPAISDLCDAEYAALLVLQPPAGEQPARLLRSSYGMPDPPGALECHP